MSQIRLIVQYFNGGVVTSLFLLAFLIVNNTFSKRINKLFIYSTLANLVLIVADAANMVLEKYSEPTVARTLAMALGYTMRPLPVLFGILILVRSSSKKIIAASWIVSLINVACVFSALFTDKSFYFTEDNKFVRGPLAIFPFILSGVLMVILIVCTFIKIKKNHRFEAVIVIVIGALALEGTLLEATWGFEGILSGNIACSMTFYYMFFFAQQNNSDALTGAFLRRRFYVDVEKYSDSISGVISLDLNDLKKLNDNEGHAAGDTALITLANAVDSLLNRKYRFYRTGGDEFMILCLNVSEEVICSLISKIKVQMATTPYTCAIGYSMNLNGKTIDEICIEADECMYKDKSVMKGTTEKYNIRHHRTERR